MKTLFITLFTLPVVFISAQNIPSLVSQQVSTIRFGEFAEYRALEQSITKSPDAVFKALTPFQTDTMEKVRQWTYAQYHQILLYHEKSLPMRREIVLQLVGGLADAELSVRNDCVDYLTECSRHDFTPQAQEQFSNLFTGKAWFSKELILLAGFIGNASCRTTLEELAFSPEPAQRRLQWHANLALSRMGDDNATNWCLMQINCIGVNDDVVYDLLPGLVYTRHQRSLEFLVTVLNSDEKLCTSSNPDSGESILCGYRVMEYLAPVIRGYPLKQLPSGDIDTKDYHRALLTARDWFTKKKGEYEILSDTF